MVALLYVQTNGTVLVQADHPAYDEVRHTLSAFADLTQHIDPLHVYQIRPVSLWQAAALGYTARGILGFLRNHAVHPLPYSLQQLIVRETAKWGQVVLHRGAPNRMVLRAPRRTLETLAQFPEIRTLTLDTSADGIVFPDCERARLKRTLANHGYPVLDRVGYTTAPTVRFELRQQTQLRPYQHQAIDQFFAHTTNQSGVVVLPCGAGKTLVAIGILAQLQMHALILTPSNSSAEQWRSELLHRTTLSDDDVQIYTPNRPTAPVTITTYQRVTTKNRRGEMPNLTTLTQSSWGIVVYDEVHMLPAPLFRLAADLQSARRLGLTATLVREDGAEQDVFSLIGPKCFDIPWRRLEQAGYLSAVRCVQVQVAMNAQNLEDYRQSSASNRHRLAALNAAKLDVVLSLCRRHAGESTLIIGHYLESLQAIAAHLDCPLITGKTPQSQRSIWLEQFRKREIRCIALSRVANLAIDLPCASIGIQLTGLFGSRQEEAQRLGRLLRPQTRQGVFYSLVSTDTVEQRMAKRRQLYLIEQGYSYEMVDSDDVINPVHQRERMDCCETVGVSEHC